MLRTTYKPLPETVIEDPLDPSKTISVRRWKLMINLPDFNIKAESITGYIDTKINISRAKNVWIDFDAIVYGSVILNNKVLIKDSAIVRGPNPDKRRGQWRLEISDNVTIAENSIVGYGVQGNQIAGHIRDKVAIQGSAIVGLPRLICENVTINGGVTIEERAWINTNVEITGSAYLGKSVVLSDKIYVDDNVRIGNNCKIQRGLKMDKDIDLLPFTEIMEGRIAKKGNNTPDGKEIFDAHQLLAESSATLKQPETLEPSSNFTEIEEEISISSQRKRWLDRFSIIIQAMNSYESDIVKIIKYPLMSDLTNPFTAEMVFARKNAEHSVDDQEEDFIAAVTHLEQKFLIAESNARKIATTAFTEDELKKTQQAKDLFSLACHEGTSEHEKRKAFKQGFNRLEGIIAIPDQAIEAMRVKVGIGEIEM